MKSKIVIISVMLAAVIALAYTVGARGETLTFTSPLPTRPPISECSTDACVCERFGHCVGAKELGSGFRALEVAPIVAPKVEPVIRQTSELYRKRGGVVRGR